MTPPASGVSWRPCEVLPENITYTVMCCTALHHPVAEEAGCGARWHGGESCLSPASCVSLGSPYKPQFPHV